MTGRKNSEFTDKTKRALAGRAGFQCSFPECRLFLIGPHSDGESTVSLGVAAHIKGAAPGSARHDPQQTHEERKHISNGIWMCWNHSVQIDNDADEYSVQTLELWKKQREDEAKLEFSSIARQPQKPDTFPRPEDRHRLDTDGKYRYKDLVISFDPWMYGSITMVKLSAEGELESQVEMPFIAVSAVQAYLASVGLRGQYLHIFSQMRDLKLKPVSQHYPRQWEGQFVEFKDFLLGMDWSKCPGMEGAVFDLIAGDAKGTGEWSTFMMDITCLYPNLFADHVDKDESQ